jgi:hypothetical protein
MDTVTVSTSALSATKLGLKTLLSSQKTYKIIRSIVQIVIIIGIFNLMFKVLLDVQINAHFPALSFIRRRGARRGGKSHRRSASPDKSHRRPTRKPPLSDVTRPA